MKTSRKAEEKNRKITIHHVESFSVTVTISEDEYCNIRQRINKWPKWKKASYELIYARDN